MNNNLEVNSEIENNSQIIEKQSFFKSNIFLFGLATLLIIFDQITKISVKGFNFFGINHKGMEYGENIKVLGDFLQWTYIENPGMAFGITFGSGKIFLSLFSVFASIALIFLIKQISNFKYQIRLGFSLIFAGAVGNLIDRVFYGVIYGEMPLFYGKVVDFILVDIPDIDFMGLYYTHWPVFNIADSCVSCGVVLLLIFNLYIPTFEEIKTGKPIEPKNEEKLDREEVIED
jgi:signal peptidase II